MTAKSFFKRCFVCVFGWVSCLFTCAVCVYAGYIQNATVVNETRCFYFVVSERENVEVGAHFADHQGGVGRLFSYNDRSYAVFSVYSVLKNGESARTSLTEAGETTALLEIPVGDLYFKTREQKRNAPLVRGAFDCLYQNIRVMEQTVTLLDNGGTQEECKRLLSIMEKQFSYMAKQYKTRFASMSSFCSVRASALQKLEDGILQSKDLRAEMYETCTGYLRLRAEFSL